MSIPKDAREKIGIERLLVLEVSEDRLELKPLKDPLANLKGSLSSSLSFKMMRKIGEKQLAKETIRKFQKRV